MKLNIINHSDGIISLNVHEIFIKYYLVNYY